MKYSLNIVELCDAGSGPAVKEEIVALKMDARCRRRGWMCVPKLLNCRGDRSGAVKFFRVWMMSVLCTEVSGFYRGGGYRCLYVPVLWRACFCDERNLWWISCLRPWYVIAKNTDVTVAGSRVYVKRAVVRWTGALDLKYWHHWCEHSQPSAPAISAIQHEVILINSLLPKNPPISSSTTLVLALPTPDTLVFNKYIPRTGTSQLPETLLTLLLLSQMHLHMTYLV